MNTDRQDTLPSDDAAQLECSEDEGDVLMQLLEELDTIDENTADAALNKVSMDDNNGGRIVFIKRLVRSLPAFLFLRRLLYVHTKKSKT